jgi:RNA polymerase sigma-70 factor (ECF subfamily)
MHEGEATDTDLWRRAVAGESEAFGQLFDRHADAIFAFCVRRTGDSVVAEDLVSATFLNAWRRRHDLRLTADGPLPWLYGIAANLARRQRRGVGRQRAALARLPASASQPDESEDVAGRVDDRRRMQRVVEALRSLPPSDQDVFVLCVWQELSYAQAAVALSIPIGTVRSRLSRARDRLRLALAEPIRGSGDQESDNAGIRVGRRGGEDG